MNLYGFVLFVQQEFVFRVRSPLLCKQLLINKILFMMKKLTFLLLLMGITTFSFTQNNAPAGAVNFYEDLYGTTIINGSRGDMDALVYVDYSIQNNYVIPALQNQGYTVTVATGWSDFDSKLANGNYGFAVAFIQGNYAHPSLTVLQNYVNNGGKMIYCDWVIEGYEAYFNLFNAASTSNKNYSSFLIADSIVLNGISNPVILTNPGWAVTFSLGMSVFGSGETLASFPEPSRDSESAMILGNGGNTIILGYLSDTPPEADRQQLVENLIMKINDGGAPPPPPGVPVSNWALIFGVFLISLFMVVRYRRSLA
jgi:hypothetical protein